MVIMEEISREAVHCLSNATDPITHWNDNCEMMADWKGIRKAPQLPVARLLCQDREPKGQWTVLG